ncbi:hypothetical protein ATCC90586_000610 [Pythium insidiosum]|nr:hypothetical protein ATCC90586_000610 [Pythium insidiosum]
MERLLLRAKNQLKQSRKMRAGQVRSYGAELQSGVKRSLISATCSGQQATVEHVIVQQGSMGNVTTVVVLFKTPKEISETLPASRMQETAA